MNLAFVRASALLCAVVGLAGCGANAVDDADAEREAEALPTASGPTCAASRGAKAVGRFQKALHDTIAYAEGTRGVSKDGYDVLFSFKKTSSCAKHPRQTICSGSYCSTASGRYQILSKTWDGLVSSNRYPTFEPEMQEHAAATLIRWRKATVPTTRALSATEFSNVMYKISYEWASLPPGRYGQPQRSMSALRSVYCAAVGGC